LASLDLRIIASFNYVKKIVECEVQLKIPYSQKTHTREILLFANKKRGRHEILTPIKP
jgi:hypothetical protein